MPRPQTVQVVAPGCATEPGAQALQARACVSRTVLAAHLGISVCLTCLAPLTILSTKGRLGVGTSAFTPAGAGGVCVCVCEGGGAERCCGPTCWRPPPEAEPACVVDAVTSDLGQSDAGPLSAHASKHPAARCTRCGRAQRCRNRPRRARTREADAVEDLVEARADLGVGHALGAAAAAHVDHAHGAGEALLPVAGVDAGAVGELEAVVAQQVAGELVKGGALLQVVGGRVAGGLGAVAKLDDAALELRADDGRAAVERSASDKAAPICSAAGAPRHRPCARGRTRNRSPPGLHQRPPAA